VTDLELGDLTLGCRAVLLVAIAKCGCQERRCKGLTGVHNDELGAAEFTHGEGRRDWPRERFGQGLAVDLVDWFREIHAYQDRLASDTH
jgi:hypothetical protein